MEVLRATLLERGADAAATQEFLRLVQDREQDQTDHAHQHAAEHQNIRNLEEHLIKLGQEIKAARQDVPQLAAQRLKHQQDQALKKLLDLSQAPMQEQALALCGPTCEHPQQLESHLLSAESQRWGAVDAKLVDSVSALVKGLEHAARTQEQTLAVQSLSRSSIDDIIEEGQNENTENGPIARVRRATKLQLDGKRV